MTDELANPARPRRDKDVERALTEISTERDEWDANRRFGYFSIPYPATVGDQSYSQVECFKHHKIGEGRKIIIENRNVFVSPLLKGKGPEVYFQRVEPETEEAIQAHKELNKKEHEEMVNKVKQRKEKKGEIRFRPGGPQEISGFYTEEQPVSEGTVYIKPDPKRFIMEGGKVKTSPRNIYTHPTRLGSDLSPYEYFGFYYADDATQERLKTLGEKDIQDKLAKVKDRRENKDVKAKFKPASLMKCDPFYTDKETYALYNEEENAKLMTEYRDFKKHGTPKYCKSLPKGAVKHDRPFAPARLIWTGRDGLFNDDLYTWPELTPRDIKPFKTVRQRKEEEAEKNKNKRMPFTYNKLMKISKFSPSISSFTTNLKKEFPTIKFH